MSLTVMTCISSDFRYVSQMTGAPKSRSQSDMDIPSIFDPFLCELKPSAVDAVSSRIDRRAIYRESKQSSPQRVPKELAAINEQSAIPVYMDGLPRPPRKCRIVSS